jgi:hypothetical protein
MQSIFRPKPRHTVENLGMSTLITIPAARQGCAMIFLSVWMVGWLAGELFALSALVSSFGAWLSRFLGWESAPFQFDGAGGGDWMVGGFLIVWLTFWTFGGIMAGRTLLWQLGGKEIIEVSRQGMKISKQYFGIGGVKEYAAREINDLRLSENQGDSGSNAFEFDYEFDTVEFGSDLHPSAVEEVLETLRRYYPE